MEKHSSISPHPAPPLHLRRRNHSTLILLLAACLALTLSRPYWSTLPSLLPSPNPPSSPLPPTTKNFDWSTAPSKQHLDYTPCYTSLGDFQCARLTVPMDYFNATTNATISLAIIRKPAAVDVTDPRYGGAVIVNPGGPGGSGVQFVLLGGKSISDVIDSPSPEDGKVYDVLSFDPRGVGLSTQGVECFEDEVQAQSWALRVDEQGLLGVSDASLGRLWAMSEASGGSCTLPRESGKGGEVDVKSFVTTASVARDMVELVEAHGKWREREAKKVLQTNTRSSGMQHGVPEALKYEPGKEKIQYWGFSYGTYLGLTFAAMFPDRIERLVVDGVVDPVDYTKALWYDNLYDTEKDMDSFYSNCARVGYPKCPLASKANNSTTYVQHRVQAILESLYHNPLPVLHPTPEVVTYSDLKTLIFLSLYTPIQSFPRLAHLLADIESRNGTAFAKLLALNHNVQCSPPTGTAAIRHFSGRAIACSDGDDLTGTTKTKFSKFLGKVEELSSTIGAKWAEIHLSCIHWSTRPLYRFTGPWQGKTDHPILLIGNTADPVTPGRNAVEQAKGFEGSVALMQESPGHCSSAGRSRCTEGYIREYFQTGVLPPRNTTCEVDELPFGSDGSDEAQGLALEDLEGRSNVPGINEAMHRAGGGFLSGGMGRRFVCIKESTVHEQLLQSFLRLRRNFLIMAEQTVPLGRYLWERIKQLGIKSVFGVPGDFNLTLLDHIYDVEGLEWVGNTNELNAAYAADGYARVKQGAGCVVTTHGVGELSALNAIAGAMTEQVKVIHVVGQTSLTMQKNKMMIHHSIGSSPDHQVFNKASMGFRVAAAELQSEVDATKKIDETLRQCFVKSGPVYVFVPIDLVDKQVPSKALETPIDLEPEFDPQVVEEATKAILDVVYASKHPSVFVDCLVQRHNAIKEATELVDKLGVLVYTSNMGKGIIDETHPNYLGVYNGQISGPGVESAFEASDTVLVLGNLPSDTNSGGFTRKIKTQAIYINEFDVSIQGGKTWTAPLKAVLASLVKTVQTDKVPKITKPKLPEAPLEEDHDSKSITQSWIWNYLADTYFRKHDVIFGETGTAAFGIPDTTFPAGINWITQTYYGSIGYCTPAALGADVALSELASQSRPRGRTLLVTGDGSLMLTVQEVGNMVKLGLKPVILLINNSGYTIERVIHGAHQSYNDIVPFDYKHMLPFFNMSPEQAAANFHRCTTKVGLEEILKKDSVRNPQAVQVVEIVMDKLDVPWRLSMQIATRGEDAVQEMEGAGFRVRNKLEKQEAFWY
ncbi:unnamed protein product [Zymoseptoria tritici ST99CH_1A5]|uniref:Pyruvate decarboxylase n=1 Tax=Zymoseptoria tritici ST99CH_1A5 TaxID=1276529 RepID=A0A1Y6LH41_ZYMTR|nr:unnamed protein product [Zymoseptoria tritici ST99CH_1A5]